MTDKLRPSPTEEGPKPVDTKEAEPKPTPKVVEPQTPGRRTSGLDVQTEKEYDMSQVKPDKIEPKQEKPKQINVEPKTQSKPSPQTEDKRDSVSDILNKSSSLKKVIEITSENCRSLNST